VGSWQQETGKGFASGYVDNGVKLPAGVAAAK
jgi:hypothetical protein